jgi:hypothetical protein
MSEASMPFHPAIDEPSKAWPEFVFVKSGNRHGNVLLFATGIGETEVDEFDLVLFYHLHHVWDGPSHQILLLLGY